MSRPRMAIVPSRLATLFGSFPREAVNKTDRRDEVEDSLMAGAVGRVKARVDVEVAGHDEIVAIMPEPEAESLVDRHDEISRDTSRGCHRVLPSGLLVERD